MKLFGKLKLKECEICKGMKSVDCEQCKGAGVVKSTVEQAGVCEESDLVCNACSGLKVRPCEKCSSKSMGELYGKLRQRADDGDINVPVLERTSSLK